MFNESKIAAGAVLLAGSVLAATGFETIREAHAAEAAVAYADSTPPALSQAFRRAAARAQPGVVHIQVDKVQEVAQGMPEVPEGFGEGPWGDMFRRGDPSPEPRSGSGSGFVFRADGYILTNNHVVDGASRVTVVLPDKREYEAEVIGRDPNTDVAVVKVNATDLPVVQFGSADGMEVGDWVVALGYPLQLGSTATAGIVSAKGRSLGILSDGGAASAPLEHFIQTDAAINPGNSGGPLVDLEGHVIGMNTAIASPTGYYSGYGFAVPIELVRRVADDLIRFGEVRRPKLGIGVSDVDPADAEVYGLPDATGAEVTQVTPGSAAGKAGLELGDVIVAVDAQRIADSGVLTALLARRQPGEQVSLEVVRYGKRLRMTVTLDTFVPAAPAARDAAEKSGDGMSKAGFRAVELTPELARRMQLNAESGVVVAQVAPGGAAARSGIAPGMLIERVNGRDITSVRDVSDIVNALETGDVVSLVLRVRDGTRTIVNYRLRG